MRPHLVRLVFLSVFTSLALTAQIARPETAVPLKNWATPLFWQPSQTERQGSGGAQPQLQFSANQVSSNALTFIAITPCRLVDTRGAGGNFNGISPFSGPSIAATTTATFPVQSAAEASADTTPAPCGAIPSIAQAYSRNLTVVPVAGGAVDYISMWPSGHSQPFVATLNDPQGAIVANAAIVPAGTVSGGISVYNQGPAAANVIIDMNGFFAAPSDLNGNTGIGTGALASDSPTGDQNTAIGVSALAANTTGSGNTATGFSALLSNTIGTGNTANGNFALYTNTTGGNNTASGQGALEANTSGTDNTATGLNALTSNTTGNNNTASGEAALYANTTGYENTASGFEALMSNNLGHQNIAAGAGALEFNTSGNNNIAIGFNAATTVSGTNSNNIHIGSLGASADSAVIRIGTPATQTSAFIAGISGATPGTPNLPVCVDGNGQLGTTGCSTPSSRRFKEQITDMGGSSSKLFQLRPVTFLYKPQYDDGSHTLQYGLIAEEVAQIYPDMVGYDKDGQPSSVKYQSLAPMLLNEVQKQNAQILSQAGQLQSQQNENRKLEEQNRNLEDRLAALETLLSSQVPKPASSQ